MPRPVIPRRIGFQPGATYFKPAGVPLMGLEEVILSFEELEALRLKEISGLGQSKAAKEMNVSQPTFFRVLSSARKKLADAVVNGKAIRVQGGNYSFQGRGAGTVFGRGFGRGFRRGFKGGR